MANRREFLKQSTGLLGLSALDFSIPAKSHSVAHSIIYDEKKNKASGVRVVNALTNEMEEYFASIIFVNASPLAINLNSMLASKLGNWHINIGMMGETIPKAHSTVRLDSELKDKYGINRKSSGLRIKRKKETEFINGKH